MAEIEIGFGAVVEHVNLAVLERIHRAGIDIEIRIELLENNAQTTRFEQRSKRRGSQSFAKRTNHAASDENVFHDAHSPLCAGKLLLQRRCIFRRVYAGRPVAVTST